MVGFEAVKNHIDLAFMQCQIHNGAIGMYFT